MKSSKPPRMVLEQAYQELLRDVKSHVLDAKGSAARSLFRGLNQLYWMIGGLILERQKTFGWGKSIVVRLSEDLRKELGSSLGFSPQNLWNMRQFRLEYGDDSFLQQLVGEVPWGQNILIFSRIKSPEARAFYLQATATQGWSRSELLQQIKNDAWAHSGHSLPHNFREALPLKQSEQAIQSLKESYSLGFLDLNGPVKEKEIETAMVTHIRQVLLEFGRGFAFMGNQYRVSFGAKEVFIDLLFYHRILRCLVAVELKAGGFEPEFAGKLNYYLNILDDHVRMPEENPSIGILLCADRDAIDVEYALRGIGKPMGIAEYRLTNKLPKSLKRHIPEANFFQISKQVKEVRK